MFGLRTLSDPHLKAARQRAINHLRRYHPNCHLGTVRLRANEATRYVFAVFYRDPTHPTIPDPYLLLAVPRDCSSVEELECSPHSPYWIRGRK